MTTMESWIDHGSFEGRPDAWAGDQGLDDEVAPAGGRDVAAKLSFEEMRLRRMLNSLPHMFWWRDAIGDSVCYTRQWRDFTGTDIGQPGGPSRLSLVHADDRPAAAAAWRKCLEEGCAYEAEYRLLHRSGEYRWVLSRGQPERDGDGAITGWCGDATDIHELVLAREELNAREKRSREILDSLPQVIWTADAEGQIDFLSNHWQRSNGVSEEAKLGHNWIDSVHPDDRDHAWRTWRHSVETGTSYEAEIRVRDLRGQYLWTLVRALPELGCKGEVLRWYGTSTDVDERVLAQDALQASESLSRGIIAASPDCVSLLDLDGDVVFVNDAAVRAYGAADSSSLVGRRWGSSFGTIHRDRAGAALAAAQNGGVSRLLLPPHNKGHGRWWDVVVAPVNDDSGRPMNLVVISRDVTDQKQAEEAAHWAANHDMLTKLPNRVVLQQRLEHAIETAAASGGHFALLLVDVDHFKQINDTLGHDAGDVLLCTFARRLEAAGRSDDTVARLGGDEFAVLLNGVKTEDELQAAVNSIMEAFAEPCVYSGRMLDCQASIGASIYPSQGTTRADLMKNADVALYAAKSAGRSTFKLFEAEMQAEAQKRSSMLSLAKTALQHKWIVPYYQPKVDLRSGTLSGFEALLRWRHPTRGIQPPATIAAGFEDLTLAAEISECIIDTAIRDICAWLDAGIEFKHVAVNASAAEFRQGQFAERLLEKLDAASIPPHHMQIEVTETVFLGRGADYVEKALKTLSAHGISIALDDFGTGFASLSHLKQFPVDILKIDRSFIRDLQMDPDDAAIVDAVINLGRSLNIEVVAEGIETKAQQDMLLALGCHYGQGYLYGKAVPGSRVRSLTRRFGATPSSEMEMHAARAFPAAA
jgi:diguanylate cyclase (GGDEF)-like protein/PAS domain S-box-containing protein